MFQDNIERCETRIDVYKSLLKTTIEILLRNVKYIQRIINELEERYDLNELLYSSIEKIQNVMININKLEYIISDLSIDREQLVWTKNF